ncbi:MAG: DUF1015 domain-containing protein [Treponema sp.]|jgi:hypothetical protein|nr:DUF1015 domain-containing protein [Treponema sp.]
MNDTGKRLEALGCAVPEIMLPAPGVDLEKWAVVACDQYTQDRGYWEKVETFTRGSPSALNIIFPEVYLGDSGRQERIKAIHQTMDSWLAGGILAPPRKGCMYIERIAGENSCRQGLLMALDLEQYDWRAGGRLMIRCTEGTLPERLPPRMDIRRGASLEIPHILVLIDDADCSLFPALAKRAKVSDPERREAAYRSPLMQGSGEIAGWFLEDEEDWAFIADCLEELSRRSLKRYGFDSQEPFLFAVGDGNHSLATAKNIWEEYKKAHAGEAGLGNHPLRWAMVEIENLYDESIRFEPIHRVLFGADEARLFKALSGLPGFSIREETSRENLVGFVKDDKARHSRYGILSAGGRKISLVESSETGISTTALQPLLDSFARETGCGIDYIHGSAEVFRLAESGEATGILLPPVRKNGLFETVARKGPLARKSFSMGEAAEKRFYLECRKLKRF